MYNNPILYLICGCNGVGKSTFAYSTLDKEHYYSYIDPDRIAKEENCSPIEAGKRAILRTKEFLNKKQDFLKESTLSSKADLKLIIEAQKRGYFVSMFYLSLASADNAVERVITRHLNGGHFIPEEDIRRRYKRSLENLPHAIKIINKIDIYDNTLYNYKHVASFENAKLTNETYTPNWYKKLNIHF